MTAVRFILRLLGCVACGVAVSNGAIDLTLTLREYTAEGVAYKQLVFKDGNKDITYELPSQWRYRASERSVKLIPQNEPTADIVIEAIPLAAPQPFDDKGIVLAHNHFMQGVPSTAQAARVIGENLNTVPFKVTNCEITASYQALGQVFMRRALYVNLPDTQLIFRLTARRAEFEGLWKTFRSSILSWQWVETASTAATKERDQPIIASARP